MLTSLQYLYRWYLYNYKTLNFDLNENCQFTVNVYGTCSRNRQLFDNLISFYTDMIFHLLWFYFIVKFFVMNCCCSKFFIQCLIAFLGKHYYWQEKKNPSWKLIKNIWVICDDTIVCFNLIAFESKRKDDKVNLNRFPFVSISFSSF